MVQAANITQAGLTLGINFAVAKVQKSPADPEVVNEVQQNELKNVYTMPDTNNSDLVFSHIGPCGFYLTQKKGVTE